MKEEHRQVLHIFIVRALLSPRCRFPGRLTNNTCCTVSNLIILTLRHLHQKLCNLVFHLHLSQDGRTVVGDGYLSIRGNENLVQTTRTERGFNNVGY